MSTCYSDFVTDVYPSACQYEAEMTFGDSNGTVSLLLDPGSSLVAVAEEYYTPSSGAVDVRVDDDACGIIRDSSYGGFSNSTECAVYSSYQDGSSLTGYAVRDTVVFENANTTDGSGGIVLGVITDIENAPNQVNDHGIVGVDRGTISMVSQLRGSGGIRSFAFGQCGTSPSMNGSFGVFGSYLPTSSYDLIKLYTGTEMRTLDGLGEPFENAVLNIAGDSAAYYVMFSGVEINGNRIEDASYSSLPTMFDTGTPSTILPSEYFDAIADHLNATVSGLGGEYEFVRENLPFVGDAILVVPTSGMLDTSVINDIFPNITLLLGEDPVEVVIYPEAYVVSAEIDGVAGFSVKFSSLGTSESLDEADGLNLGTTIVYDRFVQVNSDTSSMAISDLTPGCTFENSYTESEKASSRETANTSGSDVPLVSILNIFFSVSAAAVAWM
ncbi:hypothetical protein M9435_004455 [Picochlorum sp. BPE23]|nr:hypothetical protein M9435_004455 [Picochlorum sp. BPE23]